MRFLYGDSTPFPLDTNFIDTLKAVVEAAAALLRVDQVLDRAREKWEGAQDEAEREAARLEQMAGSLVGALQGHMGGSEAPHAGIVAARVMKAAQNVLEAAKMEIGHRRDGTLRDLEASSAEWRNGIARALDTFFGGHELPGTTWRLRWKGGPADEPANLLARATTTFAFDAIVGVDLPTHHMFGKAFKLGDLEKGAHLRLPTTTGLIRKGTELKSTPLDAFVVTEVTISPEKSSFVLRRPGKPPQAGVEVIVRAEGQSRALAKALGVGTDDASETIVLDGVEQTMAQKVLGKLEDSLKELARGRRHLEKAMFEGKLVRDLERPANLAARFIETVAPLTREMRRRGATTTELVLKHELGGGRREEIYIERKELTQRYADLDEKHRAFFESLGLDQEDITESAVTAQVMIGELVSDDAEDEDDKRPTLPPPPPGSKKSEPKAIPLALALTQLSQQN
jgi:hypothetical protein